MLRFNLLIVFLIVCDYLFIVADGVPADVISDAETNNVTSLQSMPYEAWKDEILKRAYALIQMEVEQDSDMSSSQEF